MQWKPSSADRKTIRNFAARECGKRPGALSLRIGWRYNIDDASIEPSPNIARVSVMPDWDDTDLHDMWDWDQFIKRGIELTEDGRATIDFYCSTRGWEGQLESNVQAYIEDGKLVAMEGTDLPREEV